MPREIAARAISIASMEGVSRLTCLTSSASFVRNSASEIRTRLVREERRN